MVERSHIDEAGRQIAALPDLDGPPELEGPDAQGGYSWSFCLKVRRPALGFLNGVKPLEPVQLYLPPTYPFRAPIIHLRKDFCRALPHINPTSSLGEGWVCPCVIDEHRDTFIRWNGLSEYLDRLAKWLDDAAHNNLRSNDEFWEPMRRDGWSQFLLAHIANLRARVGAKAHHDFLWAWIRARKVASSLTVVGTERSVKPEAVIEMHKTDPEVIPAVLAWAANGRTYPDLRPDQHMTLRALASIASDFGCGTFPSAMQKLGESAGRAELNELAFIVILAVRRPQMLQGAEPPSDIELLPYRVTGRLTKLEVGKGHVLDPESIAEPMPLCDLPSTGMAARISGSVYPGGRRVVLLGSGSLGSKVALHLGKGGVAALTVIDHDMVLPHNLFRMGVMFSPFASGFGKADVVAHDLRCLEVKAEAREYDIRDALAVFGSLKLPDDTVLAIDTTASPNVHDALCHHAKAVEPARLAQAAFLAGGRLGYFRVEGQERSPDLEDLEAATWRHWMLHPPEVGEARGLTPVDVGQGCTSATMVMSDMAASLLAAGMARQASDLLAGGVPTIGRLSVAVVDADGASVQWARLDQPPSVTVPCDDGWSVRLLPQLHDEITAQARAAGDNETGGYLLARVNWVLRRITLAAQLPAPPDSSFSPTLFVLGTEGAKEGMDDLVTLSMNGLIPIGTWHSHPRGGGASRTDLKTLRDIAKDLIRLPALGLIWRPDGYSAMVMEGQ